MSITDGRDVPLHSLQLLGSLEKGGQGEVWNLRHRQDLLYKRYFAPHQVNAGSLSSLVALRQALGMADRQQLDAETAWPLCRVTEGSRVTGFLMHRAPASMMWHNAGKDDLLQLHYLLHPKKPGWAAVQQPTPEERLALCVVLARMIDRLHRMGLVVGDISHANILWSIRPEPAVYLLDCDGIRLVGEDPVLAQADTPHWEDPRASAGMATVDSDRYKAALAIMRILSQKAYVEPGKDGFTPVAGVITGARRRAVGRLLTQAAGKVGSRPDLGQWQAALGDREVIKVAATTPVARPPVDPAIFDEVRQRGTINLR